MPRSRNAGRNPQETTEMIIATICAANHLPKAACLARSLRETQPKHKLVLCLIERDRSALGGFELWFEQVALASEIGIANFDSFIFRHERYEACCAVKAHFLLWAMSQFPNERDFVFLDPDIIAYSRFEELDELLDESRGFIRNQIIVTPHQIGDEGSRNGLQDNTFRTLIAGTFNLGFLVVRRSQTAFEFLSWWNRKLQALCYMEWRSRGLFVDQKWALLGVSFFDMTVLREPGYNVANWNIPMRRLTLDRNQGYLVNGRPLRCFHFSNLDTDRDLYFLRRFLDDSSPVFSLREDYLRELNSLGQTDFRRMAWSYGKFLSGVPIAPEARFIYRNNSQLQQTVADPFGESVAAFYSLLSTNSSLNGRRKPRTLF